MFAVHPTALSGLASSSASRALLWHSLSRIYEPTVMGADHRITFSGSLERTPTRDPGGTSRQSDTLGVRTRVKRAPQQQMVSPTPPRSAS